MNKRPKKPSFAARFTVISLGAIICITVVLSLLFFLTFNRMVREQIEISLRENAMHLRDTVSARFNTWSALIQHAALGASPFMAREPVDIDALQKFFKRVVESQRQEDVWLVYCTNNLVWNESGGYAAFSDEQRRPPDWNNTASSWFVNAKANPGRMAYSEPYLSANRRELTISISTTIYDRNRDIGVVAGSISIDSLAALLSISASIAGQELYLLNKEGRFITNPDTSAILAKDFAPELGLERYRGEVLSSASFFKVDKDLFIYSVTIPHVDWILISIVPTSVIFTGMNRSLIQIISVNFGLIAMTAGMSLILTRILRRERDENTAMKDNLKMGFFLMDRNYIIQGQYSGALERLFSTADLEGKSFVGLLAASMRERDISTLEDYLDMVFNRAFDEGTLEEINPAQEVSYISVETGEEKILNCGFKAVERGTKEVFVLVNIMDITNEKKLQMRLADEETKRQEEMHILFEVIQGDPVVLQDFIEDMDYTFAQIGRLLRNEQGYGPRDLMVNLYQSVHAIKSNAVILGLKTFGDKLHALEAEIKGVLEQSAIFDDDIARIFEEARFMAEEKGKLAATIQKIQSFRAKENQKQGDQVLIETLQRTCSKVSADLDKQARFVVESLNPKTLEKGPRRLMKEVLMQLIRNAVYHGIESCDLRRAQGKEDAGVVSLSITLEQAGIRMILRDDGKGLDFAKIRAKAAELNLPIPDDREESLLNIIFSPGFSTAEDSGMHAGRGIGLNLVRDRIEEVRGTIMVHTEYGKGTIFTIIIPFAEEAENVAPEAAG
ncbi:MAG: hypothetical protein LBD13_03040 [Spirochaetaceae bacterium]|jgi:two-component system chemotaxis sensor kinase CheA|nr:hypothetical protein [Spirochaetaceae bacterium]